MRFGRTHRAACAVAGVAALLLTAGAGAQPNEPAPDYFYSYFKEPIPLTLDAGRMIVRAPDAPDAAALATELAAFGAAAAEVAPGPLRGWYTIVPPPAARSDAGVRRLARQLGAAVSVEFVSPVFLAAEDRAVMVTPDLLVGFEHDVDPAQAEAILRAADAGRILERDYARMSNVYRLRAPHVDGLEVLDIANALARDPAVRFAEPDLIVEGHPDMVLPDDEHFFRQWAPHSTGQNIYAGAPGDEFCLQEFGVICDEAPGVTPDFDMDAPEAWAITTGHPSIIAVVFDCGVDLSHPDLLLDPAGSRDFTSDLCDGQNCGGWPVTDCDCHGTLVAGTIGAVMNNGIGLAGLAPECTVASARIARDNCGSWTFTATWIVNGLDWAESIGARITNHSYHRGSSATLTTKFDQTRAAGLIHFASAGNAAGPVGYPANIESVHAVSALEPYAPGLTDFSSYGPETDFSAPGEYIATTDRAGAFCFDDPGDVFDDYIDAWGTSFASPLTAGVAALVLSIDQTLTPDEVFAIMAASAVDLGDPGRDERFGWGFVNAHNALLLTQCLMDLPPEPAPMDCDGNGIADSCELDLAFAKDCNGNGILDRCDLIEMASFGSGVLSPIGAGSPQSFTIVAPPAPLTDVTVDVTVFGEFEGNPNWIMVNLNGTNLGQVMLGPDAMNCAESSDTLIIDIATFESLVAGGDAVFTFSPSPWVDPNFCLDPSYLEATVSFGVSSPLDADGNGILDDCDCAGDLTGPGGTRDGNVDALDFLLLIAQWGSPCNGSCEADMTGPVGEPDGNVDTFDYLLLIAQWGSPAFCP
jgi:hypothetical protein